MTATALRPKLEAAAALRWLLTTNPNRAVSRDEVSVEVGYEVSPRTLYQAATRMRHGRYAFPVHNVYGGGYVLLVPVPCRGRERCANCKDWGPVCTKVGRKVGLNDWCAGWGR